MEHDPTIVRGMVFAPELLKKTRAVFTDAVLAGKAVMGNELGDDFMYKDGDLEICPIGSAKEEDGVGYQVYFVMEEGQFTTDYTLTFTNVESPYVSVNMSQYIGDRLTADDVYLSGHEAESVIGLLTEELQARHDS